MRPKVKFLTVVWGHTYISRFASLALPSFLAPGNLPALGQSTELEVIIMTRRDDVEYFDKHATFRDLRAICAVRFVEIDDLVTTSVYGVTLTLAYARAVTAYGREMLDTHFVFMNADFVLADGSLHALSKNILAGHSIVLGPSFRATAEAVEPLLEARVDRSSGILAIPPRELVALSLPHSHPTTVAKNRYQNFVHSTHPNQFFWVVDDKTLLGRYYLIFMLSLKPERIIKTINCFCDYSFIPEMCPSGQEAVMSDSDDFFMLELQDNHQENFMLRLGSQSDRRIARSLQEWTTVEHRRAAGYDIVIHTEDIPAGMETAKAEARAFVERIGKLLSRPLPHDGHHYWIRGVEAWRRYRQAQGLPASPPELAPLRKGFRTQTFFQSLRILVLGGFWYLMYAADRAIQVSSPPLSPLHPDWLDFEHLRDTLNVFAAAPGARALVIRNFPELDRFLPPGTPVEVATVREVLSYSVRSQERRFSEFSHVLIYLQRKDCTRAHSLIEKCRPLLVSGGTCSVFIHDLRGEMEASDFSNELKSQIDEILGSSLQRAECLFVGGSLVRFYRRLFAKLRHHQIRFGKWALPWILPLLLIELPLVLAGNLYMRSRSPSGFFVPHCSSVSIRLRPTNCAPGREGSFSPPENVTS